MKRRFATILAAGIALLATSPAAAQSTQSALPDTPDSQLRNPATNVQDVPDSPNGYFYVEAQQGYICSWTGNGADWSYAPNGTNCLNNDILVENNGYVESLDCVEIFWGTSYGGAGAFLGQGITWDLTTGRYVFDYEGDNPEPGYLENMENNAASHTWTVSNQFCTET